ncbi:probable calcium-binding protein CML44 [Andrographis paniculata]|uniref:probable calcium-binding protein CML44 n=1 Tax=Andrographis paniculata TaxID=175694 RepID=UPI0021E76EDC|nr:probable calcium-binding protein CML44 [Andrographis paniculata]
MWRLSGVEAQRIFKELDQNDDGLVSVDELAWLAQGLGLGVDVKRGDLELLVGGKALDYADFVFFCQTLMMNNNPIPVEEEEEEEEEERDLGRAFRVFDLDGDGFISSEELRIALSRLGLWDHQHHDCSRMIAAYDANSDGLLDFHDFKHMMMLHQSQSHLNLTDN